MTPLQIAVVLHALGQTSSVRRIEKVERMMENPERTESLIRGG
jgi:hypothetical protein